MEDTKVFISPLGVLPDDDKASIRERVWDYLEKENIAQNPRPVHHRIPNFVGSSEACDRLANMDIFRKAHVVKVNPDTPQKQARFRALESNKMLLVPTPRLSKGLFNQIIPPAGAGKQLLGVCASSQGVREYSVPVGLDSKIKVDLVILGAVAVSPKGWRIGKGEGFADMEYAMMVAMGAVNDETLIMSTVHDSQVLDLPDKLFGPNDVPVDYIITPTRLIQCDKQPKPAGIIWNMLTPEKYESMPVLKQLRYKERKMGKDVRLADGSDDDDTAGKQDHDNASNNANSDEGDQARRADPVTPKSLQSRKKDPALILGDIPRGTKVGHLKAEIRSKGVSPMKSIWLGGRSFLCLFDTEEDLDDAMEKLCNIRVNGHVLKVERAGQRQTKKTAEVGEGPQTEEKPVTEKRPEEKVQDPDHLQDSEKENLLSVYVGGIPRGVHVSIVKSAIHDLGVEPLKIVWIPHKKCAFLIFNDELFAKSAVEKLQDLRVGDRRVRVEMARAKTDRIKNSKRQRKSSQIGEDSKQDTVEGTAKPSPGKGNKVGNEDHRSPGKRRRKSSRSKGEGYQVESDRKDLEGSESKEKPKDEMKMNDSLTNKPNDAKEGQGPANASNGRGKFQKQERRERRGSRNLQDMPAIHVEDLARGTRTSQLKAVLRESLQGYFRLVWYHLKGQPLVHVVFRTPEDRDEAMIQLQGIEVNGQKLSLTETMKKIRWYARSPHTNDSKGRDGPNVDDKGKNGEKENKTDTEKKEDVKSDDTQKQYDERVPETRDPDSKTNPEKESQKAEETGIESVPKSETKSEAKESTPENKMEADEMKESLPKSETKTESEKAIANTAEQKAGEKHIEAKPQVDEKKASEGMPKSTDKKAEGETTESLPQEKPKKENEEMTHADVAQDDLQSDPEKLQKPIDGMDAPNIPKDAPKEISHTSKDTPENALKNAAEDTMKVSPKDAQKEALEDVLKDTSKDALKEAPKDFQKDAPMGTNEATVKDTTNDAPKDGPKEMSKDTSKDGSKEAPVGAPKDTPKDAPEDTPVDGGIGTPKDVPKDTSSDAVKVPPKEAGDSQECEPKEASGSSSKEEVVKKIQHQQEGKGDPQASVNITTEFPESSQQASPAPGENK